MIQRQTVMCFQHEFLFQPEFLLVNEAIEEWIKKSGRKLKGDIITPEGFILILKKVNMDLRSTSKTLEVIEKEKEIFLFDFCLIFVYVLYVLYALYILFVFIIFFPWK